MDPPRGRWGRWGIISVPLICARTHTRERVREGPAGPWGVGSGCCGAWAHLRLDLLLDLRTAQGSTSGEQGRVCNSRGQGSPRSRVDKRVRGLSVRGRAIGRIVS